ncbi:G-patch domain [Teratosphaeria destructans]|uniref:Pre-mRNA-splicing factor n=1 Tax=Teratosphaeria destructans TaxID=418781 RepID=A0A9W7W053_9PEZI|nr:G-patch domain [Teratosphaeria destructans]
MTEQTGGKISLALGKKPAASNGVKRAHASLREDDEDDHGEGKAQKVSHFDKAAGGAVDESRRKLEDKPLVIVPQANRDWREASKRRKQKNGLPVEATRDTTVSEQMEKELEARKPGFGLNVNKRQTDSEVPNVNGEDGQTDGGIWKQPVEPDDKAPVQHKTDDDLAMDALLGKTPKTNLVLPAVTEEQAFEQDFHSAPDMATLDDYARVPVEQFGAALLRGMGWKDGQGIGAQKGKRMEKTKVPERRPALLGIGAKPEAAVAAEMGVWGKAARKGGDVKIYNPVLIRDKKTGKTYTEEELQKKKDEDERKKYEDEFEQEERDKERRRRRREEESRGKDGDRDRRHRDRKNDRGQDRDRDRDRERRRYDDSADEYYRQKEKERRRRERDDDHDRERSRRHDSGRDRDRMDRDSDRDRRRDRRR